MRKIQLPISVDEVKSLQVGEVLSISGFVYTGRDAALPKLTSLIINNELSKYDIELEGAAVFHTAISSAGVGPTSSNKREIEENIPLLSKNGVRFHLGKGELGQETIKELFAHNSVYAVVPPVTALLQKSILSQTLVAFPEEGIEAMYRIEVKDFPAIVSVANGRTIHDEV